MFEFSVIRKYLVPQRKQLSVALIASMSVGVIALVVWLVLIFLSVTEGIERNWLEKLTSLNAPVRITPTPAYYSSYYYLSDSLSSSSQYAPKNIAQKAASFQSDSYNPDIDQEIPPYWPSPHKDAHGKLVDPVKIAYEVLDNLKKEDKSLCYQDYEISGAMLKLELRRPQASLQGESQTLLSQASYLLSRSDKSPFVKSLLLEPSLQDLNHLFFLEKSQAHLVNLARSLPILKLKTKLNTWRVPPHLLPEKTPFLAFAYMKNGEIIHFILPQDTKKTSSSNLLQAGNIVREGNKLIFENKPLTKLVPLFIEEGMTFNTDKTPEPLKELKFHVKTSLQGHTLEGNIPWDGLEIAEVEKKGPITLPSFGPEERGVFLSKNFQDSGVLIGDQGFLAYEAATAGSVQEQRLPIRVTGFYDPGIIPVGNRCILTHPKIVSLINAATHNQYLDKTQSSGIQVWFKNIKEADKFKTKIAQAFKHHEIQNYWKVATYHEYDFAKDLLQQFQSDRYLFTLVGVIILLVACCNIISMLVILVNDKKREIGIMQAMGATPRSIAFIFGGCGAAIGILSSIIGVGAALVTLQHLDTLVHVLSLAQGHDAFNAAFFGKTLPNTLSHDALIMILIATPIISFLAGLVPAVKACRLKPSEILRAE